MRLTRAQAQERNRQALLSSARRMMASGGMDVPLDAIAEDANLTTGAVYSIFGSKRKLLLALIEEQFNEVTAGMAALGSPTLSLEETLSRYGREVETWRVGDERAKSAFALQAVIFALDDEAFHAQVLALKEAELERLTDLLAGRLSTTLADGIPCTRDEARTVALALRAMVDGLALQWMIEQPGRGLGEACGDACAALAGLLTVPRARNRAQFAHAETSTR